MTETIDIDFYYRTLEQAADDLSIDKSLLEAIVDAGCIPHLKVGLNEEWRIPTGSVRAFSYRANKRGWFSQGFAEAHAESFEKRWEMTPEAFVTAWEAGVLPRKNYQQDGVIEALIMISEKG
jgi:hypothetical protein